MYMHGYTRNVYLSLLDISIPRIKLPMQFYKISNRFTLAQAKMTSKMLIKKKEQFLNVFIICSTKNGGYSFQRNFPQN